MENRGFKACNQQDVHVSKINEQPEYRLSVTPYSYCSIGLGSIPTKKKNIFQLRCAIIGFNSHDQKKQLTVFISNKTHKTTKKSKGVR